MKKKKPINRSPRSSKTGQKNRGARGRPVERRRRELGKQNQRVPTPLWEDALFYPLEAPGMPPPGPDFLALAEACGDRITQMAGKTGAKNYGFAVDEGGHPYVGDVLRRLYQQALYSNGNFVVPMAIRGGRKKPMVVVSGQIWSRRAREEVGPGPVGATVMIIGKCLGDEELTEGACFVGPTGELLFDTCTKFHIKSGGWYMTNILKIEPPESRSGELKRAWVREWLPLLHQELRLVRPHYILCLGADASKSLLGREFSIKSMEGRVIDFSYPLQASGRKPERIHTAQVMSIVHPAAVLREPKQTEKFENGLARFGQLIQGFRWDQEERLIDHFNVKTLDGLLELEERVNRECEDNLIAIDAEWHGDHPQNEGSYIRTIQLSWKEKTAACVILRKQGGALGMYCEGEDPQPDHQDTAVHILGRILRGRRIAGHFLNSDLEWLVPLGLDLRKSFRVANTWEETMREALVEHKGGFDTAMACHAVDETADFALSSMALRFTGAPRYDTTLLNWKKAYCSEHKLKEEEFEGFGECPDEVLYPEPEGENLHYSCYDADVTRRMVAPLQKLLCQDYFDNNCWEAFWMTMRALPGILETNVTGVLVDPSRLDALTELYMTARGRLERELREWARWPDFNLNSVFQVREFLFGEEFNGKESPEPGVPVRLRPAEARSLRLKPVLSTDKHPIPWEDIERRHLVEEKTPSTDKTALGILAEEAQEVRRYIRKRWHTYDLSGQVMKLRDYRFISQVLKSTLRVPVIDAESKEFVRNAAGNYVYARGLPGAICDDGRVRSHGYPTKETGRWAYSRPPMQNFAKRRETDYKRVLAEAYKWALRSILCAPPGHLLVDADYKGAELFGMALMAGDQRMIDHAERNLLSEFHPNYYDIHAHVAVSAFGYDCRPTKAGLKSIGKLHMRIVAKAVIFGTAYGRSAKGVALAAREEGVHITVDEAQKVIDAIFEEYPELPAFFQGCRDRASEPRWICGAFGRFRRFHVARDYQSQGNVEREAMNFPIQGLVADAVARAFDHLICYRENFQPEELNYWLALQNHDAILSQVPILHVPRFCDEVLPFCMTEQVPIYPCDLDGMPKEGGPYYLGIDTEIYTHWGERLNPSQCAELGVDPKYAGWARAEPGWLHPEEGGKVWRDGGFAKVPDKEFEDALQAVVGGLN